MFGEIVGEMVAITAGKECFKPPGLSFIPVDEIQYVAKKLT